MLWATPNTTKKQRARLKKALEIELNNALIIEETSSIIGARRYGVPVQFHERYSSGTRNLLMPLDDSIIDYVHVLHVIYPSVVQFYSAQNLDTNPHYTITIGYELDTLVRKAIRNGIKVMYYDSDHCHLSGDVVRVINNMQSLECMDRFTRAFDINKIVEGLAHITKLDSERRGTYTSHIGFSSTLGQGWENPYPELDEHAGVFGLCKPGITRSMPDDLRSCMGDCLNALGNLSRIMWFKDGSTCNTDIE